MSRNERGKYTKHRRKAENQPSKYISIIIDGMDQDKTNIPHIISNPKVSAINKALYFNISVLGNFRLETHVTGIRAHGRKALMAIDCNDFKHDSNLTIELILRMLVLLKV